MDQLNLCNQEMNPTEILPIEMNLDDCPIKTEPCSYQALLYSNKDAHIKSIRPMVVIHHTQLINNILQKKSTPEKPFQCSHCSKRYNHKSSLRRHEITHCGENTFQCTHCDKSYKHRSSLIRHQITHNVEKPFNCNHCDKSYKRKYDLVRHKMNKHVK